jgi:hypothetical protein
MTIVSNASVARPSSPLLSIAVSWIAMTVPPGFE